MCDEQNSKNFAWLIWLIIANINKVVLTVVKFFCVVFYRIIKS
jgi:uncharacterized membrane protein